MRTGRPRSTHQPTPNSPTPSIPQRGGPPMSNRCRSSSVRAVAHQQIDRAARDPGKADRRSLAAAHLLTHRGQSRMPVGSSPPTSAPPVPPRALDQAAVSGRKSFEQKIDSLNCEGRRRKAVYSGREREIDMTSRPGPISCHRGVQLEGFTSDPDKFSTGSNNGYSHLTF